MGPLLAVDFTGITGDGTVLSKKTILEGLASRPADPSGRLERDQIEVRFFEGDAALVTGRTIARGARPDGSAYTNVTRIATVCARRDGRRQIVAFVAMPR
jgi:ketosteroid isomerase-like protein